MDAQQELVAYLATEQASGRRSRQFTVPDQHLALVQERRGVQVLPSPGPYRLLSAWDTFLGRDAPPVWLMPQGAITMQPVVTNLLSYDQQVMEADMLVQARIVDPVRLWQELVAGEVSLERQQVERELARRLQPVLSKHVRQYLPAALQHQAQPADDIQRAAMPSLRALLEGWGLELLAVTHLGLRPALEVVEIRRQRQAIEQKLADLRLQGQIDEMENARILQQAKDDMDLGLTDADEVRIQVLSEERSAVEALVQVLEERLDRLESAVTQRLDALAGTAPATPATQAAQAQPANGTAERLGDWVAVLRVIAAGIAFFFTLATIFYPERFPDDTWPQLIVAGVGLVLALLALFASWLVRRKLYRHRRQAIARRTQVEEQAARQQRIDQERGVRRYLEQRLRQVSSNCQQIWQRVYEHDLDLATALRKHCSNSYAALADQVQAADYSTSHYLSQSKASLDDLTQMLALSQDVLAQAQRMVDVSQSVYNAVTVSAPALETVRRGCTDLDQGRLAIANRFAEREQFLLR